MIGIISTAAGIIIAFFTVQGMYKYIQVCFLPKADNRNVTAYHQTPYRKLPRHGVIPYQTGKSSDIGLRFSQGAWHGCNLTGALMIRSATV